MFYNTHRDVISVCSALVTDTGAHYSCLPKDHLDFTGLADGRVRLDLGSVTNAGILPIDYLGKRIVMKAIHTYFDVQID